MRILLHALKLDEGPRHFLAGNYHHVENLAKALGKLPDVQLTVLADEYSLGPLRDAGVPASFILAPSGGRGVLAADAAVRRVVRKERPDIYHRPTGQLPWGRLPCRTVAGIADLNFATQPTGLVKRLYKELSYRWTLAEADRIVCVSDYTRQAAAQHFRCPVDRMLVIHHGANQLPPASTYVAEQLDGPFWLTFGQQPHKNVEACIDVLAKRRSEGADETLVVVGESQHLDIRIRPLVKQRGMERVVRFVGRVSGAELHGLYRSALGLMFMSKYEGFGLPVLEAMRSGCPVICSNVCSLPEIAGDAALMADPDDVLTISGHCQAVRTSGVRRQLLSAARRHIEKFTWEAAACRTHALYREVLGRIPIDRAKRVAGQLSGAGGS